MKIKVFHAVDDYTNIFGDRFIDCGHCGGTIYQDWGAAPGEELYQDPSTIRFHEVGDCEPKPFIVKVEFIKKEINLDEVPF